MLSQLRDASKSWVAGILIALLILAFAVWGVEDIFRTRTETAVAKVGDTKIEGQTFLEEFERMRLRFGEQADQVLTREQALAFGLDRITLNQLISRKVLDVKAEELSLVASDRAIRDEVASMEVFNGPTGRFDPDVYRSVLRSNGMTPAMFEDSLRSDTVRTQLVDIIPSGVRTPRVLAEAIYRLQAERRRLTYLVIPSDAAGEPGEPDDAALQEIYEAEEFRFTAPEYRDFTYLLLRPEDLVAEIEVAEEEIVETYEFRKANYTEESKRTVEQIVFESAEAAAQARQRIDQGTSFETVAQERGLGEEDIALGALTKEEIFDPAVAEAVFALEEPGVTPVIEGTLGPVIVRVTNIAQGSQQTLEDVRDEIRNELALERARDAIYDLVARVEDGRGDGQSLEEIAQGLDLTLGTVKQVDRRGLSPDGMLPDTLIPSTAIVDQAFESDVGLENDFGETGDDGFFVVRVDDVTQSAQKPFDEVREDLVRLWQNRQRTEALETLGQDLADKARRGENLEALAASVNGRVVTPVDPVGRDATDEALSNALLGDLFKAPEGTIISGPANSGGGFVVARAGEIVPAAEDTVALAAASFREPLAQALGDDLTDHMIATLRDEIGVQVNDRAVATALGQNTDTP